MTGDGRRVVRQADEFTGFTAETMRFLRALRRNNRREWFEDNRARYDTAVKGPMAALVEEMDARFAQAAPEITGDPRRSVFRIHRDIRFSADKSPYKTHAACWFYHRDAGKGVGGSTPHGGAGFYFHVEPGASMVAGGLWMPPGPALKRIREALAEDHATFEGIVESKAMRRRFGAPSDEAMLKRVPRGFDPEHPAARWLRFKSFTMHRMLEPDEVLSPKLAGTLERDFAAMLPMVRWLNAALGFPPAARR